MTPDDMTPPPPQTPRNPPPRATRFSPWLPVAVAALALAGWQWFETRDKLVDMQEQVARRLAEADAGSKEDRGALKQMREQVESLQGKLGAADARLTEFQSRSEALQALYQDLARSREDSGLLEAEQAIVLAGQQLQLAGNVPAAILALRTAETRLAGVDRPQAMPLRKALAQDLERLTALCDLLGLSLAELTQEAAASEIKLQQLTPEQETELVAEIAIGLARSFESGRRVADLGTGVNQLGAASPDATVTLAAFRSCRKTV